MLYENEKTGLYYLQSRYYDASARRFINADVFDVLENKFNLVELGDYIYCRNNPINFIDKYGNFSLSFTSGAIAVVLVISVWSIFLSVYYWIVSGFSLTSLLNKSSKIAIKSVTMKSTGVKIPNRLIDKDTGNIDLSKFNRKQKGKTSYKEKGGEYR